MGNVDVRGTADLAPGTSVTVTQADITGGTGAPASGDTLYVLLANKPSTSSPSNTAGGMALVGTAVVGTGSAGTGTGPIRLSLYKLALTSASFSVSFTAGGTGAVMAGAAAVVRPAAGETITELWTTGSDTSHSLTISYSGAGVALVVNNLLLFLAAGTSQASFSSAAIALTNGTLGTLTTFGGTGSSTGDDLRTYNARRPIATVTGSPSVPSFSATTGTNSSGGGLFLFVQSVSPNVVRSGGTTATGTLAGSRVNAAPAAPQRSGGTTATGVLAGSQTVPSTGVQRSGGTTAEAVLDGSRTVVVLGDARTGSTTAEAVLGGSQAVAEPEQHARSGETTATGTLGGSGAVALPPAYPRSGIILANVTMGVSVEVDIGDTRSLPRFEMPAGRPAVRWMAQDILTREWLSTDLQVSDPQVTEELSAPATLEFTMRAEDLARLELQAWAVFVHVEVDGAIRGSGILMPWSWGGETIKLTARGVTCYPNKTPYRGTLTMAGESGLIGVGLDPLDVVRHIWDHLQSHAGGDLGVVLDATKSLVRIGTATSEDADEVVVEGAAPAPRVISNDPADPRMVRIRLLAQQISADADVLQDDLTLPTDTLVLIAADADYIVSLAGEAISEDPGRYGTGRVVTLDDYRGGPYSALNWWENTDCGSEINSLAEDAPFDYLEAPTWTADRTDVVQRVRLGWPRLGHQPAGVAFTEGVNLVEALTPIEREDAYASEVIVLGKGEGPTMVRGGAAVPRYTSETVERVTRHTGLYPSESLYPSDGLYPADETGGITELAAVYYGRVRRVFTVEDGTLTSGAAANRRAEVERLRRQGRVSFESARVRTSHPASRLGSFRPGDDVPVRCTIRGLGDVSILHRITSIQWVPGEDVAGVSLDRTDTLRYGGTG